MRSIEPIDSQKIRYKTTKKQNQTNRFTRQKKLTTQSKLQIFSLTEYLPIVRLKQATKTDSKNTFKR
jgi:hypothetical protein